jgi:ATP-binding protein involved in chromosome partitioning
MAQELTDALGDIEDPALGADIVSLGLVGSIDVDDGVATVPLALGAPYSPVETDIVASVREAIETAGYDPDLVIDIDDRTLANDPGTPIVVGVASGRSGVGKTTVAVNLAAAVAGRGAAVGLLDLDVDRPTVPRLLGVRDRDLGGDSASVVSLDRHGIVVRSVGSMDPGGDPGRGRAALLEDAITALYAEADWSGVDFLVVDFPIGIGGLRETALDRLPVTGVVGVTTPQTVAIDEYRAFVRAVDRRDAHLLGSVVNMSGLVCPDCGEIERVSDGADRIDREFDAPVLGEIPFDPTVQAANDHGRPIVTSEDRSIVWAFERLAMEALDRIGALRRRSHVVANGPEETGTRDGQVPDTP